MSDNGVSASLNHFFKENERLKQDLKELQERIEIIGENRYGRFVSHGEWEALRAEADRYCWLREHTVHTGLSRWMGKHQFLDAAIDAARRTGK